jgi:streptogramin lyase
MLSQSSKLFFLSIFLTCHFNVFGGKRAELSKALDNATELRLEKLGRPIRTVRTGPTLMVKNKNSGTWDILQVYFTQYGGPNEIVIIDGDSGKIQHRHIPRKPYVMQWHMCQTVVPSNGKLFIYTGGLTPLLHIYDPKTNNLDVAAVKLPSAFHSPAHGHPMTIGPDGKIYCAAGFTENAFGFCRVDPNTLEVENFGAVGAPEYGRNLPWSIAVDKTHVYIVGAKLPWSVSAYNLKTGETRTLFAEALDMSVSQTPFGCSLTVHGGPHAGFYWLDSGKAVSAKKIPPAWVAQWKEWKKSGGMKKGERTPEIYTKQAQPGADGECLLWIRFDNKKSPGKNADSSGNAEWRAYRYKVETTFERINRIAALPNKTIFGAGGNYGGEFIYIPSENRCCFLGKEHVNVYTISVLKDEVFFSGYPSSATFAYAFRRKWNKPVGGYPPGVDKGKNENPRFVGYLAKESHTHKMYASAVGADGKIYFGGRMMRDGSGGGIAWIDPETGKKGGVRDIFSNYQIRYMTTVDNGRYIVISTHSTNDQTLKKPKPSCGRLFVLDTVTGKITRWIEPLPDCLDAGVIAGDNNGCVLGLSFPDENRKDTKLYRANVKTGKILFIHPIGIPINLEHYGNETEPFDFQMGPDGMIWTFFRKRHLVRIDPKTGDINVVGKLPSPGGQISFLGNDLYMAGAPDLRVVRGLLQTGSK